VNLVSLGEVEKGYAAQNVLRGVSGGIAAGDRIGVVGANGAGKSTLLALIAGEEAPDAGEVTRRRGLAVARLGQGDEPAGGRSAGEALAGERPLAEWAREPAHRAVLDGLLGGVGLPRLSEGAATPLASLSGGERRRVALARLLLADPELLLLDEPTNHLDIEAITWLAAHLVARAGALVVVTHDRWFLDAVCTATWEVADGIVRVHDGGYAAYVLARAERERREAAHEERRQGLLRKELAWLRRGPPARSTKPRFRIEAANALIADEPPARDGVELLRFAGTRLGDKVLDAVDVTVRLGGATLLDRVTWRLGPGDRLALMGANGAGKTTLLRLLAGELAPDAGSVERGQTVRLAHLSQDTVELPGSERVLESLESVRRRATLADGRKITAGLLCDRFGFRGERARTPVRELSGGERRRLALMRLLMGGPNVLLLDEPTNDLDIDTLTALEDLLDGWPGTLVVVSHDRYFVERVADNVFALPGDGTLRHLPGGVEQYLARSDAADTPAAPQRTGTGAQAARAGRRADRAAVRRLERELERSAAREAELAGEMAEHATEHERLGALQTELDALLAEREELEAAWLELAEELEDPPHTL
jgi:ATP-binding cassette subfamily F protein uup